MKKGCVYLILAAGLILYGCNKSEGMKINIAVTGSPSVYSEYYEKGIKRAYADVCEEYKDSGFEINVNFYDDNDSYEEAEKITAGLVNDDSVTAIIGSSSEEICKNQVYQTNKTGKILISPHLPYDSILTDGNYDKVFSLNYSSEDIGIIMESIAKDSPATRWTMCYSDDEVSRTEIKEFKGGSGISVVDFVKENVLLSDFDKTVERWKLLGVEGVVLIPYDNEGFELLYRLKKEMPELYIIGDAELDDQNEYFENINYFVRVYMVNNFFTEDGESEVFAEDESLDTWEIHGYNTIKMIVDTAIENDTNNPAVIAEILHKNGYDGELESYKFDEKGALISEKFSYLEFMGEDVIGYIVTHED
ncbi:MAG: ABC transporter substrate-binding protein [Clostridia bacterium]|nr:ABC transporter substrate-binding protein [Clostridia bacterium]